MSILTDPVWQVSLGIALSVAMTIRAWIGHRTAVAREQARTERLHTAIDGTDPRHRPDILRACNGLEYPPSVPQEITQDDLTKEPPA